MMKKAALTSFTGTALLLSVPSMAQQDEPRVVYSAPNLFVTAYDDSCGMAVTSEHDDFGDMDAFLFYHASPRRVSFSITSDITTSLPERGEVVLNIQFRGGAEPMDWNAQTFSYQLYDGTYTFTKNYFGNDADVFLSDFSNYETVGLTYNDRLFTGARLTGTAVAVERMRQCAFNAVGLNENDPFAR